MTEPKTDPMTMNLVIHAAFRRDLLRFGQALAAFQVGSVHDAGQLETAWANYADQLHRHHEDEETIFWPALRESGVEQPLVGDLEGEHAAMLAALDEATAAMRALRGEPTAERAASAEAAVAELSDVLLGHLEHEERSMEPLSVAYHHTEPMQAAKKAVRRAHRGNMGVFLAWLRDGIDPAAKAGLDDEIPPFVQRVLRTTSGRRYTRKVAPTWR